MVSPPFRAAPQGEAPSLRTFEDDENGKNLTAPAPR